MGIVSEIIIIWNGFVTSLFYVFSSFRKNLKALIVGVSTVFICVCFLYILQSAVSQVPAVFMRISENQVGEGDILLQPRTSLFMNYTEIKQKLENCSRCDNIFPRWLLYVSIVNGNYSTDGVLNVYNSTYENEHNIGRGWKFDPLNEDEIVVSGGAARRAQISEGSEVIVRMDFPQIMNYLGIEMDESFLELLGLNQKLTIDIPLIYLDPNNTKDGKLILSEIYFLEKAVNATGESVFTSIFISGIDLYIADAFNKYVVDVNAINPYDQFVIKNNKMETIVGLNIDFKDEELLGAMKSSRRMRVKGIADSAEGKYPQTLGNVISMDEKDAEYLIESAFRNVISYEINKIIKQLEEYNISNKVILGIINQLFQQVDIDMDSMVFQIYIQMKDRVKAYYDGDKLMKKIVVETTDEIADILGVNAPLTISAPLSVVVSLFNYLMYLLQQIFNFIVAVFAFMGGLLVYCLLIADVESKTYEFGMLRALGLLKSLIIEILIMESTTFSVIGVVLGLIVGYLASIVVNVLISSLASLPMTFIPNWQSVVIPFAIGFIVPIVSNILPIKKALSKTLRNALDLYHSTTNEVSVTIKKIQSIGINPSLIIISLVMISASFMTYYIIPLSFLQLRLDILFLCFLLVLLAFLGGLCLLGQIVHPFIQKLLTYIIVTPLQSAVQSIVLKNLDSHSTRNKKTALMLTVAISFVLFAGSAFSLSENTLINVVKLQTGADIQIRGVSALNVTKISDYLVNEPRVIDFSFVTFPLHNIAKRSSATVISNLAMYPLQQVRYIAVDDHFTNTVYNELITPVKTDSTVHYDKVSGSFDVVSSLYDSPRARPSEPPQCSPLNQKVQGKQKIPGSDYFYSNYTDILIAEGIRDFDSVHVGDNVRLRVTSNSRTLSYLGKVRATLKTFPGQTFSSFYSIASQAPIVMSIPQMQEILNTQHSMFGTRSNIIYSTCFVRVKEGVHEAIVQDLRTLINDATVTILDSQDTVETIQSSIGILQIFFIVVSLIAILLCFFVMLLSFTSNVHENSWEFAVLRAVGFSSLKVVMIYIYEALCLTFTSIILGTLIGTGVASLVNLQFVVFMQLPYIFTFPWINTVIVYVLAIVVSILASFIPSWLLTKKPISSVLKGQV